MSAPGNVAPGGPAIHILPPEVVARIAAGEVIERPASVVRELLDNAIDAGPTRITVEVDDGGLGLIRVTDDGCGIPPDQVELAFERHATSKIRAIDDLRSVATLGFRGEALPSIAAAADVELITRARGEPVGLQLVLSDGHPRRRAARPSPIGTSFAVRDLFARLPARRKFLHTATAEGRQVTILAAHYALAYPDIAFQVMVNGRRVLSTAGDGDLRHAFAAVYGPEAGAAMLALDLEMAGVRVSGLASPPSLTRGNRSAISVFVNGRWVQSRALTFAIVDAYQSQLPGGRFPLAALALSLPAEEVDVNVHPAKAEVRFRDERAVSRAVRTAVAAALDHAGAVAWSPAAGPFTDVEGGRPPASLLDLSRRVPGPVPAAMRLTITAQPVQSRMGFQPGALPGTAAVDGQVPHRELLPLLRVVGQLNATYIVAEGPDGMYLVDQHAAHERVVYDRLLVAIGARREAAEHPTQPLLEPALVELDPVRAATLEAHAGYFASLGLVLEPFGPSAWLVRAVPTGFAAAGLLGALGPFLDQLAGEGRVSDPFLRAAATIACHSSVRAGTALAQQEMRALVDDLAATTTPRTCPHGRPTLISLGHDAIERQFGRR